MSSLSAIFFDLDGTLVDSSIGIHNGFTYTLNNWESLVHMQKPSVVLWDLLWKLVSLVCLPTEQIEWLSSFNRSYYKEKESTKLSSFHKSRNYSLN